MKKASLQLSIEAIVIIILAITLLGLGLTFMRQFIGKGSEEFSQILDISKLDNPATVNTPLTAPSELVVRTTETSELDIGFYCDSSTECREVSPRLINCNPLVTLTANQQLLIAPKTNVGPHQSIGFKTIIDTSYLNPATTYICTLEVASRTNPPSGQQQKKQIF